jgi:hypothetical protein
MDEVYSGWIFLTESNLRERETAAVGLYNMVMLAVQEY